MPLAVLIEGQFPWPEKEFVHPPRIFGPDGQQQETEGPADYPHPEPDDKAPGRLLMIGCSEMFKDQRLTELRPEFRPDHLLLNAAAAFALEPALAEVITRRAVPQGFEPVPQEDRIWWRVIVLGAMPALLLLLLAGPSAARPSHGRDEVARCDRSGSPGSRSPSPLSCSVCGIVPWTARTRRVAT